MLQSSCSQAAAEAPPHAMWEEGRWPCLSPRWYGVVLSALLAPLAAAHGSGLKAVAGQEFQEVVNSPRAVSSTAVTGLMLLPASAALPHAGNRIWIRLTENLLPKQQVRVELESADGRYRGYGLFDGEAAPGQWLPVSLLDSGKSKRPPDIALENVSVMVTRTNPEGRSPPQSVVASWSDLNAQPPRIARLYVNSRRANGLSISGTGEKPYPCQRVSAPSAVVFDHYCDIPLSELKREKGRSPFVTITRRQGFAIENFDTRIPLDADGG